jgi:hypothetical protein
MGEGSCETRVLLPVRSFDPTGLHAMLYSVQLTATAVVLTSVV